jgi:two-component system, chemotaxis family, sensor kinase CheA
MENEFAQDAALIKEFLVESEELLQGMDQDMVALESSPKNEDLLNRIFRALHTIKGTSGFLGFDPMVRLGHRAEDVLNTLRRGESTLTRRIMDCLLATRDQLGKMLADIRAGGLKQYEIDGLLAELEIAQKASGNIAGQDGSPGAEASSAEIVAQGPAGNSERSIPAPAASDHPPAQAASAAPDAPRTMRVDVHKLDDLIDLIGELVLERNRLMQLSRDLNLARVSAADFSAALNLSTSRLSFVTEELQVAGLRTRMVPIETVFKKFPRLVRDVAHLLKKDVALVIQGEDTELDKTMVELISDPLIHLVRNSLDHGLEMPEARIAAGKARAGTIRLEARQEGDQIVIVISDDGAGMDPERIAHKAIEKGLATPEHVRSMSEKEIFEFIFLPGFSTAEKVTDLSGRGVGMDVVRCNLKKLNGTIEISSRLGSGTTVQLRLPLTLAILPLLLVEVADEVYGLPLRSVIETARIRREEVHWVEGSEVLRLRGQTLPLLRLRQMFDTPTTGNQTGDKVVVLGIGERKIAVLVDHLLGQESTVIKPLGAFLHRSANLAGATISGDGRVRLVLDPAGLLSSAIRLATETIQ